MRHDRQRDMTYNSRHGVQYRQTNTEAKKTDRLTDRQAERHNKQRHRAGRET